MAFRILGDAMKRWQKWGVGIGSFFVLCGLFIAFVLPGIVRGKAVAGIETATGRKAAIARVVINPLTWTVRVEGFRLREKGSDVTFASFSSVRVKVSPRSLYRLAPIVSEAQLTAPYVHVIRTAANAYNFSDLMEGKKEEKAKPLHFSLNNITIANGSVDFIDRAIPAEKRHTLRRIEVGIPFVSNIPYLADRYVLPRFGAVINGSPLNLEGKLKPFVKGAETSIDVNLKELSLPFYFSYYPGTPPVQMDSGRLSTTLEVTHRVTAENKPELEVKGDVVLADLKMRDRGGAPLLSLVRGAARIGRAQVMARDFALSSLVTDGLEMYLSRDRQGGWNFQRLAEGFGATTIDPMAVDLVEAIYRITKTFPEDEKFGLIPQLRRAAVSVPSNIAEGNGKWSTRDRCRCLRCCRTRRGGKSSPTARPAGS